MNEVFEMFLLFMEACSFFVFCSNTYMQTTNNEIKITNTYSLYWLVCPAISCVNGKDKRYLVERGSNLCGYTHDSVLL